MEINWGNKKGTREIKKVNLNPKDSCNKLQELRKKALRMAKTLSSRGLTYTKSIYNIFQAQSINPPEAAIEGGKGLDIRSIGLFRIAFGLVLIHNLYLRFSNRGFSAFFTQTGLIPVEYTDSFSYSLLNSIVGPELTIGFIVFSLVVYLCYTIGYKTNIMKWLIVIVLLTLFHRARFVTDGSDMVLRLFAIWAAFLPVGARYSIDSLLKGKSTNTLPVGNFISFPLVLFLANLSASYFLNSVQKDHSVWGGGLAVKRVFWDAWVINPLGAWIRDYTPDKVFSILSEGTLLIELAIAFMIIAAIYGNLGKVGALILIFSLHFGFSLFMYIGSFNWAYYPIALLFVPSFIWDRFEKSRKADVIYVQYRERKKIILPSIFAVYSLTAMLAYNHIFPKEISTPMAQFLHTKLNPIDKVFAIGQQWFMYMSPDKTNHIPVVEVIDKDGKAFDFLRNRPIYNDYFKNIHQNPKNMGKYWVSYCFHSWTKPELREPLLKHLESNGYKTVRWIDIYQEISDTSLDGYPKYSSKLVYEIELPETINLSLEHNPNNTLSVQDMSDYDDRWANKDQIMGNIPKEQGPILLEIEVPDRIINMKDNMLNIDIIFTTGPDFGRFEISQAEKEKRNSVVVDLYNPSHIARKTQSLVVDKALIKGKKLKLEISPLGKSDLSSGTILGIDTIILNPWKFESK